MSNPLLSRRTLITTGGAAGLTAVLATVGGNAASAATSLGSSPAASAHTIIDMGPAVVQFSLMSAKRVGNKLYIGSRNLEPARVVALDLASGKVVAQTTLSNGDTVQAMDVSPDGNTLYLGINQKKKGPQPNLFSWDLTNLNKSATPIGTMGDRDVRDMSVSPDGHVFAVGNAAGNPPSLWEYDPAVGTVVSRGIPEPTATQARAVAATDTTVFFGAGSSLAGSSDSSRACLFAYDRANGTFTLITPAEMENDPSIRGLAIHGDKLLVGTSSTAEPAKVAAIDLQDLQSYQLAVSLGVTAKKFTAIGDDVYFGNDDGVCHYDLASNTVNQVALGEEDLGEIWGVDAYGSKILLTSAFGIVITVDPAARSYTVVDLGEAGAEADPQKVMGVASGGGYVYAGGNGTIARHSLSGEPTTNLRAPGEAKDAVVVGTTLYTGQYSGQGMWMYDPNDGLPIRQAAAFPKSQNRPLDVLWDESTQLVLVGNQSDTEGGGSLWTYDPVTGEAHCFTNPIDDAQLIRGVAARNGVAYLGGGGPDLLDGGTITAFDPVAGHELWRMAVQSAGTAAMVIEGQNLYSLARNGILTVIDVESRQVIHQVDISALSHGFVALINNGGVIYGCSKTNVFRFDPASFAVETVLAETNADWYSGSHLSNDESGNIYTLRKRNLIRIELPVLAKIALDVTARPMGRNIALQVTAKNNEDVAVDVSISTQFGSKHLNNVQPGKSAFHSFTVRATALSAGEVSIESRGLVNNQPVSSTRTVSYSAFA